MIFSINKRVFSSPPNINVIISNEKKFGFETATYPPFCTMSWNILFFLDGFPNIKSGVWCKHTIIFLVQISWLKNIKGLDIACATFWWPCQTTHNTSSWTLDKHGTNPHDAFFYVECICNAWFTIELFIRYNLKYSF